MTKKQIIESIFKICRNKNIFEFDNNLVKSTTKKHAPGTNPYDITKIDDMSKLPESVIKADYFIAHLGNGKHKFIKGIDKIYHSFEKIENDEII
jgi:hypothetical protein